ncbi:unnamed protein product [Prunus armeniaca]|uniref:Uncharacterized protein n=1 Tax=Prunus armeniaca TaxID=36596 RepID=A0A6J5W2K2_PRUAR|nr:unnamed protein product [Prunus armeniaca]CAB4292448.1 unnamed protein product [Prunus armeniaca]
MEYAHSKPLSTTHQITLHGDRKTIYAKPNCNSTHQSKAPQLQNLNFHEGWLCGRSPEAVRQNASKKHRHVECHDSRLLSKWAVPRCD